jgi:hypothetical protein
MGNKRMGENKINALIFPWAFLNMNRLIAEIMST